MRTLGARLSLSLGVGLVSPSSPFTVPVLPLRSQQCLTVSAQSTKHKAHAHLARPFAWNVWRGRGRRRGRGGQQPAVQAQSATHARTQRSARGQLPHESNQQAATGKQQAAMRSVV